MRYIVYKTLGISMIYSAISSYTKQTFITKPCFSYFILQYISSLLKFFTSEINGLINIGSFGPGAYIHGMSAHFYERQIKHG